MTKKSDRSLDLAEIKYNFKNYHKLNFEGRGYLIFRLIYVCLSNNTYNSKE